jgi:carboxymethylenebutenolidase
MGEMIQLTAGDGHELSAYRSQPDGPPKAGVVIVQEIFGITNHIQAVTDVYAEHGYLAIAPAMFDRIRSGVTLDYAEVEQARGLMMQLDLDKAVDDMAAAADLARSAGKVAVIGYCWGGAMADLAACRAEVDAAVAYYGRMIVEWLDLTPNCPVMYHFGETDPLIPAEMVEQIKASRPDGIFHNYPAAGHGFNCTERADFHPESAALALQRTLQFLNNHL